MLNDDMDLSSFETIEEFAEELTIDKFELQEDLFNVKIKNVN